MLSWILIPGYLLRNTLHRWIENLASPATKVMVPLLLSVLALLILGALRAAEAGLREQLERDDLRMIRLVENRYGDFAKNPTGTIAGERSLWAPYCERYESFQTLPFSVETRWSPRTPVVVYDQALSFIDLPEPEVTGPREILLYADKASDNGLETVLFQKMKLTVGTRSLPNPVKEFFDGRAFLLVPIEMIESEMDRGYTHIQLLIPPTAEESISLETKVRSFSLLEKRSIRTSSSTALLKRLRSLLDGQKAARLILGLTITLILSLILASLSLLEFRQEAYLMALLRSFGVGVGMLLAHIFLETCFLTILGVVLGVLLVERFVPMGMEALSGSVPGLRADFSQVSMVESDLQLLAIASVVGVCLAVLPVFVGLRKRPGLILS